MMLPFFVYGTLLPGQPNHHLLANGVISIRPATLYNGRLYDLGHYPMLIEENGRHNRVQGSLITVKQEAYPAIIAALDKLEGYDPQQPEASAYHRCRRRVALADRTFVMAWVYIGHARYTVGTPPVLSGDWRRYIAHKMAQLEDWWATIDTVAGLHQVEEKSNER